MRRLAATPGFAPGSIGALLLLQLGALGVFASADTNRVFVAGRELRWGCWFRQHYGVPCPTCGMTRSVILALHGQLGAAWQLNPAGVLLVLGILLFGASMLLLVLYQRTHDAPSVHRFQRFVRVGTSLYGGLLFASLLVHWLAEIS